MIQLKSAEDIERLAEGGAILAAILDELCARTVPGVTPQELDRLAQERIAAAECTPAFLHYAPKGQPPFPAALCVSVNSTVVHGLPSETPFAEGDLVGLDVGLVYQGRYYLDSARTVGAGQLTEPAIRLLAISHEALSRGIAAAQVGRKTGDVGAAVQSYVESCGFNVVRALVGHGVGFAVHEEPQVPNFGRSGEGAELTEGLVIAIEPMVVAGDPAVTTAADGWGIVTADGSLAAHQEHTVAITAAGPRILTMQQG
jgi:methionyl aminopeptidase